MIRKNCLIVAIPCVREEGRISALMCNSFYLSQSVEMQDKYCFMLARIGAFSHLFSSSETPYLETRISENLFCRVFEAHNVGREDCTADATKSSVGIGIKTWINSNRQKIAEFNKLRNEYNTLSPEEMINRIAQFRNDRINSTIAEHGLKYMLYHCIIREKGKILVCESPLELINMDNIRIVDKKSISENVINFTDGIHNYSFNTSKSVLYNDFTGIETIASIPVSILDDPFLLLEQLKLESSSSASVQIHSENSNSQSLPDASLLTKYSFENESLQTAADKTSSFGEFTDTPEVDYIFLPLYAKSKNGPYVPEKSGLNQWNAGGRQRDPDELYIPIPIEIHKKYPHFFPNRDTPFSLELPDGTVFSSKVCQENGKALMSNPNRLLGQWILRNLLGIKPRKLVYYRDLLIRGFDSMKIVKKAERRYGITFAGIGSYERFIHSPSSDECFNDSGTT